MALILKVDTEYGVPVEYWRIGGREEHVLSRHLKVAMVGYLNAATAQSGKSPIAIRYETLDHVYVRDATLTAIYDLVKRLPGWEGAQDA